MELKLVDCEEKYWEFVRLLRTDPINQKGFFTKTDISSEDQIKYMSKNHLRFNICLANDIPAGYIGVSKTNEITYCVSPKFHSMGIGTYMVNSIILKKNKTYEARVKIKNIASQKVFEKLGFEKQFVYIKKYGKNHICNTK